MLDIEYYQTANGNEPVKDFIEGLDTKLQVKTLRSIQLLEEYGNSLREPESKPLGDGLFELRASFSRGETRVLYFFWHKNKAVLTHGFIKKSQKTPLREIEKAKKYRDDYRKKHQAI